MKLDQLPNIYVSTPFFLATLDPHKVDLHQVKRGSKSIRELPVSYLEVYSKEELTIAMGATSEEYNFSSAYTHFAGNVNLPTNSILRMDVTNSAILIISTKSGETVEITSKGFVFFRQDDVNNPDQHVVNTGTFDIWY